MKAVKHVTMENSTRMPFLAKVRAVSQETPRRPAIHKTAPVRTQSRLDTVVAPLILAFKKWRQAEDLCEYEVSLVYISEF